MFFRSRELRIPILRAPLKRQENPTKLFAKANFPLFEKSRETILAMQRWEI